MEDSTGREGHQERLVELGESLAELMHDLRGPLTTICGFADLMSIEGDAEKRRAFFDEINQQVNRLARMSSDTLAFARGERPVLLRKVQVYAFGAKLEHLLAREFCGTGISPRVVLQYRGPASLDVPQILRAAENLARNARQAMAETSGTYFEVNIERADDELVLTFTDDGPGLPEKVRAHAFDAFVSGGRGGGTGLGLHVVKKIARAHGGDAELRKVDRGACVVIRLPWNGAC